MLEVECVVIAVAHQVHAANRYRAAAVQCAQLQLKHRRGQLNENFAPNSHSVVFWLLHSENKHILSLNNVHHSYFSYCKSTSSLLFG